MAAELQRAFSTSNDSRFTDHDSPFTGHGLRARLAINDPHVLRREPLPERADQVVVQVYAPRLTEVDLAHRAAVRVDDRDGTRPAAVGREHLTQAAAGRLPV